MIVSFGCSLSVGTELWDFEYFTADEIASWKNPVERRQYAQKKLKNYDGMLSAEQHATFMALIADQLQSSYKATGVAGNSMAGIYFDMLSYDPEPDDFAFVMTTGMNRMIRFEKDGWCDRSSGCKTMQEYIKVYDLYLQHYEFYNYINLIIHLIKERWNGRGIIAQGIHDLYNEPLAVRDHPKTNKVFDKQLELIDDNYIIKEEPFFSFGHNFTMHKFMHPNREAHEAYAKLVLTDVERMYYK